MEHTKRAAFQGLRIIDSIIAFRGPIGRGSLEKRYPDRKRKASVHSQTENCVWPKQPSSERITGLVMRCFLSLSESPRYICRLDGQGNSNHP